MNVIIDRMKEPSTWRGLAMLATAFGVSIAPEMIEYIVSAGVGLSGLIGMFSSDTK